MKGRKITYFELLELLSARGALLFDPVRKMAFCTVRDAEGNLDIRVADGPSSTISNHWWTLAMNHDYAIVTRTIDGSRSACVEILDPSGGEVLGTLVLMTPLHDTKKL